MGIPGWTAVEKGLDDLTLYETVSIRKFYFTFPSAVFEISQKCLLKLFRTCPSEFLAE
jgi:hypothetical protein